MVKLGMMVECQCDGEESESEIADGYSEMKVRERGQYRNPTLRGRHERENCCCCYLIASWYVRKALKAFVNTKLILIK